MINIRNLFFWGCIASACVLIPVMVMAVRFSVRNAQLRSQASISIQNAKNKLSEEIQATTQDEFFRLLETESFPLVTKEIIHAKPNWVNITNVSGETPLSIITGKNQNIEMLQFLIQKGADVNFQDHNGNTPLHLAAKNESQLSLRIMEILVESGADIDLKNQDDKTPLDDLSDDVFKTRLLEKAGSQ